MKLLHHLLQIKIGLLVATQWLVSQRTRAYRKGLDVLRWMLMGFTYKRANFTTNLFNFGWTTPTEVLSLGLNF